MYIKPETSLCMSNNIIERKYVGTYLVNNPFLMEEAKPKQTNKQTKKQQEEKTRTIKILLEYL